MFAAARGRCLRGTHGGCYSAHSPSRPLLRAGPRLHCRAWRTISATSTRLSKIGRKPLSIPPGVEFEIIEAARTSRGNTSSRDEHGATVRVRGPLGEMSYTVPPFVEVMRETAEAQPTINVLNADERSQREMWGTVRAYLQNHILGVSEGHTAILRLNGVGYRATIETTASTVKSQYDGQQFVNLKVGYSHPVELGIPKEVRASTPQPTRILLEGADKVIVMSFAAKIRAWRPPEPYKGKGIFVNDEDIRLKSKKIK